MLGLVSFRVVWLISYLCFRLSHHVMNTSFLLIGFVSWLRVIFFFFTYEASRCSASVDIRFRDRSHLMFGGCSSWLLSRIYNWMSLSYTIWYFLWWPLMLKLLVTYILINIIHSMHLLILAVPLFSIPLINNFLLFPFFLCFFLFFQFSFAFSLKFF